MTIESLFRVEKLDHPDLIGGVWTDCELDWINERITLAILAEREACANVCECSTAYTQFQTVEHYKLASAIANAIRARSEKEDV